MSASRWIALSQKVSKFFENKLICTLLLQAICTMSGIEDDAGDFTQFNANEKAEEVIRKMKFRENGGTITKADFIAACNRDRELFLFLLPW